MATKTLQQAFGGGEVSPDFWGRVTDSKYQTGLAACRNFVVLPHGPAANRAGFRFVRAAGVENQQVRLIPFTFNTDQTMVLEFGHLYVRFHTQGATVLDAGNPYQVTTPYTGADVMDLHYVQSNDVLTLVHPGYAPRELRRLGATNWTLTTIGFSPAIAPFTLLTVGSDISGGTPTYPRVYSYAATKVSKATGEESLMGVFGSATNDLSILGNFNFLEFPIAQAGSGFWVNIYKRTTPGGYWGYIGTMEGDLAGTNPSFSERFRDYNIEPDFSRTPPEPGVTFSATGDYPAAVTYHEQRRWFGGTNNSPLGLWATKSGTESNMSRSLVPRDDDALSFRVASREANRIRHLVPMSDLLPFTAGSEMRVTSVNTDAITPTSVNVKTESYIGANNAQPVVVNRNIVYAAARGGHVRELGYSEKAGGQGNGDLSLRAVHLFDTLQIRDLAYAKAPYPIVWAVSSNGTLLGLTYVPEQEVGAWHRHDTDGQFESVCCVAEGNEDVLYAVVARTVNGSARRYIERMSTRMITSIEQCFFVDAGLTYSGSPATVISGLGHLEGKTVAILADGAVHPPRVVASGSITLDAAASVVHVGLPYTAELRTLPLAMQVDAALGQGRMKNVNAVYVRTYQSGAFMAGPNSGPLREAKWRTNEPFGAPPSLRSGEFEVVTPGDWNAEAQVTVQQPNPLPLTVVSMTTEVVLGG